MIYQRYGRINLQRAFPASSLGVTVSAGPA